MEERIKIDKKKQTERFHVPAHNEVDEADIIFDFKKVTMCIIHMKKSSGGLQVKHNDLQMLLSLPAFFKEKRLNRKHE